MAKKRQFMGLVEPETLCRLDALRIVMNTSRARVAELGWEPGGLAGMEAEHAERLARLQAVADRCKLSMQDYTDGYSMAHVRGYGPTLEELEAGARFRNPFLAVEKQPAAV